jgi:hypothetical protein
LYGGPAGGLTNRERKNKIFVYLLIVVRERQNCEDGEDSYESRHPHKHQRVRHAAESKMHMDTGM